MLKTNDGHFSDRPRVGSMDVRALLEEYFLPVSSFLHDFVIIYSRIDLELRGEGGTGESLKRRRGTRVINLGGNLKTACLEAGHVFATSIELLIYMYCQQGKFIHLI